MEKKVTCECGAVYGRSTEKVIFRDKDSFACGECGTTIESWNGSVIPVFRLISKPPVKSNG